MFLCLEWDDYGIAVVVWQKTTFKILDRDQITIRWWIFKRLAAWFIDEVVIKVNSEKYESASMERLNAELEQKSFLVLLD